MLNPIGIHQREWSPSSPMFGDFPVFVLSKTLDCDLVYQQKCSVKCDVPTLSFHFNLLTFSRCAFELVFPYFYVIYVLVSWLGC